MRKYPNKYYDLHVHTMGSLLDGAIKTTDLAKLYIDGGAVTDHGQAFELIDFYKAMKKEGKKPILGVEVYTDNFLDSLYGTNLAKSHFKRGDMYHLVVLAKNNNGLKNLFKLVTISNDNQREGKPVVDLNTFKKFSTDCIILSACLGGELSQYLKHNDYHSARKLALFLKEMFGEDYYIEIQRHNIEDEQIVNPQLVNLSNELDIRLVATSDAHYISKDDNLIHDMLLCIGTKKTLNDPNRFKFPGENYHLPSITEMETRFKDLPDALDQTVEIFKKCDVNITFPKGDIEEYHVPEVLVPEPYTQDSYLRALCMDGFKNRFASDVTKLNSPKYLDRLNYEIDTIAQMKYSPYFLIVKENIDIAQNLGIYVGPGRGSVAGSLVAFCLNITDLDPLEFDLIFERFLNKERVSMPDIDLDFEDSRRIELIQAIKSIKGDDFVAQIATFGTLGARESIRSIVRVLDYEYSFGDKICKSIPTVPGITIEDALKMSTEFKNLYTDDRRVFEVVEYAKKIEGLKRNLSTHAAGVVIADKPLSEYLPLAKVEGNWITQVYMNTVEELGLLKIDILGLKTLTVIRKTIESINSSGRLIDYKTLPIYDIETYKKIISTGLTDSVFQLESNGMKSFMKDLYSDVSTLNFEVFSDSEKKNYGKELFERLIAGISLYRPGPMDSIPMYLENMKSPQNIRYLTPLLENILKKTYGVIIYQEQVMQIVQALAGYSLGSADIIRRAMGKKDMDIMQTNRKIFTYGKIICPVCNGVVTTSSDKCDYCLGEGTVSGDKNLETVPNYIIKGAVSNGVPKEICNKIFDLMVEFAKYAFNKSHGASYAVLSAKTAYLKCYYPVEFMTANLNCVIGDSKKIKHYLQACKKMNITILSPCVNSSFVDFTQEDDNCIRFGLEGIKHLGKVSHLIQAEREQNGNFDSYQNFVERMSKRDGIDKIVLEAIIYSGALDIFEGSRKAKLSILNLMLECSKNIKKNIGTNQISLFDCELNSFMDKKVVDDFKSMITIKMPLIPEFEKNEKLNFEKDYSGVYITEHPLDDYSHILTQFNIQSIAELTNSFDSSFSDEGLVPLATNSFSVEKVCIFGILKEIAIKYSKNGRQYLIGKIEDTVGELEILIFEDTIKKYSQFLYDDKIVMIHGYIENNDFGLKVKVFDLIPLENILKISAHMPFIKKCNSFILTISKDLNSMKKELTMLYKVLPQYKGDTVIIIIDNNNNKIKSNIKIDIRNPFLLQYIDNLFNAKYKFI